MSESTAPAMTGEGATPATASPDAATAGGKENGGTQAEDKQFTQADLNRLLREQKERDRKAAEKERAALEEAAAAKALAEQGEFKTLAEKRAAQIAELEPFKERAERAEAALTKHVEAQMRGLPKVVRAALELIPDPVAQLEFLAAHHDELVAPKNGANGHVPSTPKPDDGRALADERTRQGLVTSSAQLRRAF